MGVLGLWQLLDPTGKPVRLETLEGKVLAIDISIWLNQLVKGYRGAGGASIENAHLVGLFQRVCKLLHFKIKPVFVFDGEAPALKYQTLATRKRRREDGNDAIRKATQKMLQTYVQQKLLGEANPKVPKLKPSRRQREDEMFKLPEVSMPPSSGDDSISDADVTYNADLANIKIDSEEFKSLPPELQHEFLVALKEREKRGAVPVDELPVDSDDFSSYQMSQILKKNKLQAKIEQVQKDMNDGLLRMASDPCVQVLLKVSQSTPHKRNDGDEALAEEDEESPSKKAKLEPIFDGQSIEYSREKKVENFLVSQWLEGAQRGEEKNETLQKAVQLVRDDTEMMSDSGASSDEQSPTARKRLLSTGGKISAEQAMKQHEPSDLPVSAATSTTSRDSLLSDGLSLEVGHGSILSASTTRVMQPDEQFDEGSHSGIPSDDDKAIEVGNGLIEDSADQTCNTDVLNADLEVSETGNSVFKIDDIAERSKSQEDDNTATSSQSCKLTEVKNSPVIKEVSFLGGTQSSLNSNDDIVLPHNLSRYTSKNPSRCNSNSMGFVPGAAIVPGDNPTNFHQALEIIKEQERRQSVCTDNDNNDELLTNGNDDNVEDQGMANDVNQSVSADDTANANDLEKNNNHVAPGDSPSTSLTLTHMTPEEVDAQKLRLEVQSQALQNEINRLQRQTNEITASMADECAELLELFGIPVVRAPREAEAQCAALENAGLVNGIVTDDSDIFLFGGETIYKNLFSHDHQCELFTAKTIETRLKLSRDDLIGFAMLTGSDYTNGIENVGPVTACEILSEFRNGSDVLKALRTFKEWWELSQRGAVPPKNSVRTRFIKLRLDDKFPSEQVFNAYKVPTVEVIREKFTWSRPNLDLLRSFTAHKFNWTQVKSDSYLLPLLKKFEDRSGQPRIDSLLLPAIEKRENLFPSKRLKAAVGKIRNVDPPLEAKLSESSSDDD